MSPIELFWTAKKRSLDAAECSRLVTFLADLTNECKFTGFLPDTGDTVLLTGGRESYTGYISSALLYPEGCSVPDLNGVLQHHTTFLTQESPARIATCGGSPNSLGSCWVLQGDSWRAGELVSWFPGLPALQLSSSPALRLSSPPAD